MSEESGVYGIAESDFDPDSDLDPEDGGYQTDASHGPGMADAALGQ